MAGLLFGVETEYAVAGLRPGGEAMSREEIVTSLMDAARRRFVWAPDLHPGMGMFLQNASRLYVDCGSHPELATSECANPWDAVRYIEAGHKMLAELASSIEADSAPGTEIIFFRSNVDLSGTRATWACHENYLHRRPQNQLQPQLIPHLVTRVIYTGAGGFHPFSQGLEFTLSPRMAHFECLVTENSTRDRGLWHTKSEPLCDGYKRLHLLCGESQCSETATFLKIGATALVTALADAELKPGSAVQLADPLEALRTVTGDPTCSKKLRMVSGEERTAINIQRHYLEMAEAHAGHLCMPAWTSDVCRHWRFVLDLLEGAPDSVSQTLDWAIKWALYKNHAAHNAGIPWDSLPVLNQAAELSKQPAPTEGADDFESIQTLTRSAKRSSRSEVESAGVDPLLHAHGLQRSDLDNLLARRQEFFALETRFGQLGSRSIFHSLNAAGVLSHRIPGVDNIDHAVSNPPAGSRASIRGQVIQRLARDSHLQCGWEQIVDYKERRVLDLTDPFAQQESWRPLAEIDDDDVTESGPHARREAALSRYLQRDFIGAEELLRGCVAEEFELPSTFCHLTRVLLMMNRDGEAREEANHAWERRELAPPYVVARTLFFRCLFAMQDGAEFSAPLGQIKSVLHRFSAHSDWTIRPMLDHLRPRLGEPNYTFLRALADALSNPSAVPRLNDFPQWVDAPEASGADAPLPADDPDDFVETGNDRDQDDMDVDIPF
ncbi:MAG: proteasome accessory factor PafA2 family protein [Acidobacteriaceae bacterium]